MERITYAQEELEKMSNGELLAALDDVVQMNLLKESNIEWMKGKRPTYRNIIKELSKRL